VTEGEPPMPEGYSMASDGETPKVVQPMMWPEGEGVMAM